MVRLMLVAVSAPLLACATTRPHAPGGSPDGEMATAPITAASTSAGPRPVADVQANKPPQVIEPTAPIVIIEARAVDMTSVVASRDGVAPLRLVQARVERGSPTREAVDHQPRPIVERGMIPEWVRQFENEAPIAALSPAARDDRWRAFLLSVVPSHLREIAQRFFMDSEFALVAAYEARYGSMVRIERFATDGGVFFVALFVQKSPTAGVSIFREHHAYTAVAFQDVQSERGFHAEARWALDLEDFFSGVLELNDIQLARDGTLIFNAVYPSYAKEVKGQTGYLQAVDPDTARLRWRSDPLVSRSDFVLFEDVVISGFGFTAEPDFLYAMHLATGSRLSKLKIPSAHDRLRMIEGNLSVATYDADLLVEIVR